MNDMNNNQTDLPYYIFVNGGDTKYLLDKYWNYLADNDFDKAMRFYDEIAAAEYIEKRGLQRLATFRKRDQFNTKA